jgi:hypothetical protein
MVRKLHTTVLTTPTPEPVPTRDELLKQVCEETIFYIKHMREHNDKDRQALAIKLAAPNADFTRIVSLNLNDMIELEIKEGVVKYFDQLITRGEDPNFTAWEAIKHIYDAIKQTLLDGYSWQFLDLEPTSTSISHNACAILRQSALKSFFRNGLSFVRYNAKKLGETV